MPFQIKAQSREDNWKFSVSVMGPTLLELMKAQEIPIRSSCMGKGLCHQCRVKIGKGLAPASLADRKIFKEEHIREGWRLSCTLRPKTNLELFFPQSYQYTDDFKILRQPQSDWWIACDLGTTGVELVAIDERGAWAQVKALNKQIIYGADVMTRLEYAQRKGVLSLQKKGLKQLSQLLDHFIKASSSFQYQGLAHVAGNSAVTAFLANRDIEKLAVSPYLPDTLNSHSVRSPEGVWSTLPLIHSFVGGDLTAGLFLLWKKYQGDMSRKTWVLMDVGTNSEIIYWDSESLYVSSTPAGPAFEGSSISIGMRAESGAITEPKYVIEQGQWTFRVIHDDVPKGICGSALIDMISQAVELGFVKEDGEVMSEVGLTLTENLGLNQDDIREFQLAKSAIRTGLELVVREGVRAPEELLLAGNFGFHLNVDNCFRLGMFPDVNIKILGNSSLEGTIEWGKASQADRDEFTDWLEKVKAPIELALRDDFQEAFIANMNLA